MSGDERIGPTAHYTAYVWYRLGLPHAELFATRAGRRLFWAFRGTLEWPAVVLPNSPTLADWLEMRHLTIEHRLEKLGPDRVVEIAGGLSRRGVTWAADRGIRYVEVDLPHMVEAKRRLIARRGSPQLHGALERTHETVADDVLSDGFVDRLAEHLSGAERPVVIAEGLLTYFDLVDRERIMHAVASALARSGSGDFLCDMRTERGAARMPWSARAVRLGAGLVTRGRGHRRDYADERDAERAFRTSGFTAAEPLAPAARHSLPFPGAVWHAHTRA